jgi:DNA-binding GntR family transcriptional regulator
LRLTSPLTAGKLHDLAHHEHSLMFEALRNGNHQQAEEHIEKAEVYNALAWRLSSSGAK